MKASYKSKTGGAFTDIRLVTAVLWLVLLFLAFHFYNTPAIAQQKSTILTQSPQALQGAIKEQLLKSIEQEDFAHRAMRMATVQQKLSTALEAKVKKLAQKQAIEAIIEEKISPEEKIDRFLRELAKLKAKGKSLQEIKGLLQQAKRLAGTGSISGTVTVGGSPSGVSILTLAFDDHGFFASEGEADPSTGAYTIGELAAGSYYVVTRSMMFVDEIYNNVPALLGSFENWRQAGVTTVAVTEGSDTGNIDFDLMDGAHVTGTIYEADGTTPIPGVPVNLVFFRALLPQPILPTWAYTGASGEYQAIIPLAGSFKLLARVGGYMPEWYNNKSSWQNADVITTALGTTTSNIDFSLQAIVGPPLAVGNISGTVYGPIGSGLPMAVVLAVDTTFTKFGYALTSLFPFGQYIIENLPVGSYLVYANDYLGNIIGMGNYIGEFYQDAPTPDAATFVQVQENATTPDIDFTLGLGGSISGNVSGPGAAPMDSIIVLAFKADTFALDPLFMLANFDFAFDITDPNGDYELTGLPTGNYILRTFTPPELNVMDLFTLPGTHFGTVVDEYYDGVHNPLELSKATKVQVTAPNPTTGIDFTLDAAGAIVGKVTAADGITPVPDVILLAIDPASGLPELAIPDINRDTGDYTLALLPSGPHIILAIVDPESEIPYLSELYDGVRNITQATPVVVNAPAPTTGINFTLDLGATIQGFVNLSAGYPAGADTLWVIPVVAYDTNTGKVVSASYVQFNGGYRIKRLPPGSYKIAALPIAFFPIASNYAGTYYGGGDTFDDAMSTEIPVAAGDTFDANITLEQAQGSISGYVRDAESGRPVALSMVIAYDQTGHAVNAAFSGGADLENLMPISYSGDYQILGLRSGNYYVRTWTPMQLLALLRVFEFGDELGLPDLSQVGMGIGIFTDEWYDDIPIKDWRMDYDPYNLVFNILSYGFLSDYDSGLPFYLPIPYSSVPLSGASLVQVDEPNDTPDKNFDLGRVFEIVSEVKEGKETNIPEEFALHQNYPNPFNPETVISYQLPASSHVELSIHNILGQEVARLVDKDQKAGYYKILWKGTDDSGNLLASGVYFYQIKAGRFMETKKMILMR